MCEPAQEEQPPLGTRALQSGPAERPCRAALLRGPAQGPCSGALQSGPAERPCRAALQSGPAEGPCRAALLRGPVQGPCSGALQSGPAERPCSGARLTSADRCAHAELSLLSQHCPPSVGARPWTLSGGQTLDPQWGPDPGPSVGARPWTLRLSGRRSSSTSWWRLERCHTLSAPQARPGVRSAPTQLALEHPDHC